jgi:hypothetical protein
MDEPAATLNAQPFRKSRRLIIVFPPTDILEKLGSNRN